MRSYESSKNFTSNLRVGRSNLSERAPACRAFRLRIEQEPGPVLLFQGGWNRALLWRQPLDGRVRSALVAADRGRDLAFRGQHWLVIKVKVSVGHLRLL